MIPSPVRPSLALAAFAALAACSPASDTPPQDDAGVVNIYTSRHYSSDYAVYDAFTEQTGVAVNHIEADGDLLIERVRADGERSNADIIITVDAGRLHRAEQAGLFQPAGDLGGSLQRVPENLRHPDGLWFGFASRARVIAYSPERVDEAELPDYAGLADPRWRGRICTRSSGNVYTQSLMATMTVRLGEEAAEDWAAGVVANLARAPQGGDTDQIRAVAAGECDLAIVNQYYWVRMARQDSPEDRAVAEATALHFPDQDGAGVHLNISGAGLAAGAPNEDNARAFLAFLLSEDAQRAFPELTNEYPAIADTAYDNPILAQSADVTADPVNVSELGERNALAQRIFDRVGWP